MKWKTLGVLWLMVFLYIFNYVNVSAATPPAGPAPVVPAASDSGTPSPSPTIIIDPNLLIPTLENGTQGIDNVTNSSCGFAGDAKSEKCCGTVNPDIKSNDKQIIGPNISVENILNLQDKFPTCYFGTPDKPGDASCKCVLDEPAVANAGIRDICKRFASPKDMNACNICADNGGLLTGMGCVPLQLGNFINSFLLPRSIGLAGVIAFFCIIISAFRIQISRGEKEALQKAREVLTSCIIGMLLIIFAVFILQVIGVNILKLPGLT